MYAKLLVVTEIEGQQATAHFDYARGAIYQLRPDMLMTLAEAQEFGALYGTCCVCGRTLTDEGSIAAGIGPICAGKSTWAKMEISIPESLVQGSEVQPTSGTVVLEGPEEAPKQKRVKKMAKNKRCEMGCGRPADSSTPEGALCIPCYDYAGWENTHSDNGHEGIEALTVRNTNFKKKADLDAWRESERKVMEQCWVCHPELNLSAKPAVERTGTSREGMVMNVPLRASGKEKAETVVALFTERKLSSDHKVSVLKGIVTFRAGDAKTHGCRIQWDSKGRYLGAVIVRQGKERKVRNVSEMLRLMAEQAA